MQDNIWNLSISEKLANQVWTLLEEPEVERNDFVEAVTQTAYYGLVYPLDSGNQFIIDYHGISIKGTNQFDAKLKELWIEYLSDFWPKEK